MPSPSDALALREILSDLSVLTIRDLVALWRRYSDSSDFQAILQAAFPELIGPYAEAAAMVSAQWYDESAPDLEYHAVPVVDLPADRLTGTIGWALYAPGAASPLDRLTGSAQRMIFDSSRETMLTNLEFEYGDDDPEPGKRWARYASTTACSFCKMLATRGGVYRSAESAGRVVGRSVDLTSSDRRMRAAGLSTTDELLARRSSQTTYVRGKRKGQQKVRATRGTAKAGGKYHDNCVPAGTLVSGPRAESAYRRLYEGEAVVLHTASGQKLTITPNHPVLTDKGWVPAGLLNKGSHVVRATSGEARPTAIPDENQGPALIEDVWRATAVDGLVRVPGSTENFHGDGTDSEVEVVGANSLLRRGIQSEFIQPTPHLLLAGTPGSGMRPPLSVGREFASRFPGPFTATNGFMCGCGEFQTLLGGGAGHANLLSLLAGARLDTEFHESSSHDDTADAIPVRDLKFGDPLVDVEASEFGQVERDASSRRFDPAGAEFSVENGSAYSELGLDLLRRLGGQVELDCVVQLDRISFTGHVYNLETSEGWYSASSLIISNCHCLAVPVRPGQSYNPPSYVEKWESEYNDAVTAAKAAGKTKGEYGAIDVKAVLRQMDSAHK